MISEKKSGCGLVGPSHWTQIQNLKAHLRKPFCFVSLQGRSVTVGNRTKPEAEAEAEAESEEEDNGWRLLSRVARARQVSQRLRLGRPLRHLHHLLRRCHCSDQQVFSSPCSQFPVISVTFTDSSLS